MAFTLHWRPRIQALSASEGTPGRTRSRPPCRTIECHRAAFLATGVRRHGGRGGFQSLSPLARAQGLDKSRCRLPLYGSSAWTRDEDRELASRETSPSWRFSLRQAGRSQGSPRLPCARPPGSHSCSRMRELGVGSGRGSRAYRRFAGERANSYRPSAERCLCEGGRQLKMPCTTSPCTSVSRKSRPW